MEEKFPIRPWHEIVDSISQIIFRIYAGNSMGTGFVVSIGAHNQTGSSAIVIATAWHVIKDLSETAGEIIAVNSRRGFSFSSKDYKSEISLLGEERYDTGIVFYDTDQEFISDSDLSPIIPVDTVLMRGAEIGWLGFPGFVEPEMCFFNGCVSGYTADPPQYLVDGVAINGVSGGPAFDNRGQLIGLVTSYIPNRINKSTTLPGLMALTPINSIRNWLDNELQAKAL